MAVIEESDVCPPVLMQIGERFILRFQKRRSPRTIASPLKPI
jgi:hypothetical protein